VIPLAQPSSLPTPPFCLATRRLLAGILLSGWLAGCAALPATGDVQNPQGEQEILAAESTSADAPATADSEAGSSETSTATAEPAAIPEIEYGQFSEDVLTRTIMAELAIQRGQNEEALEAYVALAQDTGNLSIIQRAMRLATFLRNSRVALEMGELWLSKEPDSTDARQMMAVQLVFTGRYGDAMDQMAWLLERGVDIDFRLIPARSANDSNAALILDALIADFQELLQRHPDAQSLRLGLAMLYEQNQQIQEAYDLVAVLARETNNDAEVVMQEVRLLELLEQGELAQRRLEEALQVNPEHKQLRFLYGRKLISEERYRDAKDQFTLLVEQDPRDFDMVYSLALLCMEVNMFEEARGYLQRLVANGQKLDDAHYYLGFIDAQENRPDAAIAHYLQVKSGKNFLQALRNLTELMVQAGRYPEAQAHLQNARFRNADYNIPLLGMEASILIEQQQFADASKLLNSAIGAFPNNIQLLFQRSVLHQEQNDLAAMEADLRQIILLDPNSPVAYNSLGYTLADRTDRYQEAYELIRKAVELAPNDPAIIDSLGWVQFKLGMLDDAQKNLERAYELFPDPEVAAHLGEVYWVRGNRAAANRIWRSALEVQPDSEFVLNAMERLNPGASR
jgi:tetratricopeptide (TPR) repeat protein